MKKIFLMTALAACTLMVSSCGNEAKAQGFTARGSFTLGTINPYHTKSDTVTNTGADTLTVAVPGQHASVALQANVVKVSGTATGYRAQLQAAMDFPPTNYVTLYTDSVLTATAPVFQHSIPTNPYTGYRWILTGFGTAVCAWQGWLLIR